MDKEYNIIEVMELPIGTELIDTSGIILEIVDEDGMPTLKRSSNSGLRDVSVDLLWVRSKFKIKQTPKTFKDICNTDQKVRLEHEFLTHSALKYLTRSYNDLVVVLRLLTSTFYDKEVKNILDNAKWYMEV